MMPTTPPRLPVPGTGERLMAAFTLFTILINPLGIVLGLVEFIAVGRRRPYLAYHGLQAMWWQLFSQSSLLCIGLLLRWINRDDLRWVVGKLTYPSSENLHVVVQFWGTIARPIQLGFYAILLVIVCNVAVSLWGVVTALRGKTFRVPIVGRLGHLRVFYPS